ncbi:VWA domain-containing protein, partial [bacterium]|nr:VWA domain-containing protein [bacterium]
MTFRNPWVFTFLLLLIPFVMYTKKKVKIPSFRFSSDKLLGGLGSSFKLKLAQNLIFLRATAIFFVIIALAGPQSPIEESKIQTEGIDIVLAVDCSTSMLAEDFKLNGRRQNRLEVVKDVVKNFVQGRKNDRIALIAFAGRAYTACPLTLDYSWLLQ